MSFWLVDPELFLYAKGIGSDDAHLWRCKKPASSSSSLVVPMKPGDFDYVSKVENHMELIGDLFDWEETDYKILVKYISERRLLINSHGFVIAELYKVDKDGNKLTDGPDGVNEEVPIYIRSLDVLPLKPYIPKLRERPIPLRTVKYLEDVNGKAALMEEKNSKVIELTARVAYLESKNKTMEGKVTKLTADLVTLMNDMSYRVWMNELTSSEWVGVEGLIDYGPYEDLIIVGSLGTFTMDDSSTNVRARYWYKIKLTALSVEYKAVSLEDLTPNKERARFLKGKWWSFKSKGKTYVADSI